MEKTREQFINELRNKYFNKNVSYNTMIRLINKYDLTDIEIKYIFFNEFYKHFKKVNAKDLKTMAVVRDIINTYGIDTARTILKNTLVE